MKKMFKVMGATALLLVVVIVVLGGAMYVAFCTGHPHGMC